MPGTLVALAAYLIPAGTSLAVANAITTAVFVASTAVELAGVGLGIASALNTPTPEALHDVEHQAIPTRREGVGTTRLGGFYLLDYANNQNDLQRVIAFCDGPVNNITRYYLAQDRVALIDGTIVKKMLNGAYPNDCASIFTTFGVTGVPAFPDFQAKAPGVWTADCFGTGIFMGATGFYGGSLEAFPTAYPRGKAVLNIVGEVNVAYDWRDEAQSQTDPTTWKNTSNPVVALVHHLWFRRGYDWATDFLPTLDILTNSANICDEPVEYLNIWAQVVLFSGVGASHVIVEESTTPPPVGTILFAGGQSLTVTGSEIVTIDDVRGLQIDFSGSLLAGVGIQSQVKWQATPDNPVTEPRYSCGGAWNVSEPESDTVKRFIEAMDGFMMRRGSDGAVVILAGQYVAPTDIIGPDEVISYTWQPFIDAAKVVTELVPAFVAPAWDYTQIDTDPWRDDDAVASYGLSSQPFQPDFVQRNGQVRRLAKRRLSQLLAHTELFTFKISALRILGKRYIRLMLGGSETADLEDIVMEVCGDIEIVNGGMELTVPLRPADPDIDAWDPYTDEGNGPAATTSGSTSGALDAPTITAADVVTHGVTSGGSTSGDTLVVDVSPPTDAATRADLTWWAQWRIVGATNWNPLGPFTDLPAGDVELDSPFVPTDQTLELQARYQTGGSRFSDWSASFTAGGVLLTEGGDTLTTESGDIIEPDVAAAPADGVQTEAGDNVITEGGDKLDQDP